MKIEIVSLILLLIVVSSYQEGADRYIYSNIFPCNYSAGRVPNEDSWIIRAPLGEPKCNN